MLEQMERDGGPSTPLLDTINYPMHMKNLSQAQLRQLCQEIRSDLIHTVSQTGGHLGASLGVVELTVAMHYVFNCPADRFLWDVGHQAYVHKMLTGRRDQMHKIRQYGGISGVHTLRILCTVRMCAWHMHARLALWSMPARAAERRRRCDAAPFAQLSL